MSPFLSAALVVVSAVACWFGTAVGLDVLRRVGKVAVVGLLLVLAIGLGVPAAAGGAFILTGLALSIVGDAFLYRTTERAFLVGLGTFVLVQVAYILAFMQAGSSGTPAVLSAVVGVAFCAAFAWWPGRRISQGALASAGPVLGMSATGYGVVTMALALAAGFTARPLLLVGALLFVVSSTVLGLDRFHRTRANAPLVILVTYHLAQACVVVGAVT